MDVQMPEMNGFEAARRIRRPDSGVPNNQVPIIALTANAMKGDRELCLEAGMDDYISKPVTPQALMNALNKWLPKILDAGSKQPQIWADGTSAYEEEIMVFDKKGMLVRLMDDEDLARMVIDSYLKDMPHQIEKLQGFMKTGDSNGVEHQAHTIKGASANIGGEAVREVAFEIEMAAKAGDMNTVNARMPELEIRFACLEQELKEYLSQG